MRIGQTVEFDSDPTGSGPVTKRTGKIVYRNVVNIAGRRRELLEVEIGDMDVRVIYADECRSDGDNE